MDSLLLRLLMHHIVYTSTASVLLTEAELHRLLDRWRTTNARLGITGILLYSEGHIMQVLEGEATPVLQLFAAIAVDVRHRSVTKVADGPVASRTFADWSMRFRTVDSSNFARLVQQTNTACSLKWTPFARPKNRRRELLSSPRDFGWHRSVTIASQDDDNRNHPPSCTLVGVRCPND